MQLSHGATVNVSELAVGLGLAEVMPQFAVGDPALMQALVAAQAHALVIAREDVGQRVVGATLQQLYDRVYQRWEGACREFTQVLQHSPDELLPSARELQEVALDFGAPGAERGLVTHVLKGDAYARRVRTLLGAGLPRLAVDVTLAHSWASPWAELTVLATHPKCSKSARSAMPHEAGMTPCKWKEHGFPWLAAAGPAADARVQVKLATAGESKAAWRLLALR
jgi:hypothetical protein